MGQDNPVDDFEDRTNDALSRLWKGETKAIMLSMSMPLIKRKGWWWNLVPFTGRNKYSSTVRKTIYLTPKRYDDYTSGKPSYYTVSLIEHEKVHVAQYLAHRKFILKYLFSWKQRRSFEIEAYGAQLRHLKSFEEYSRLGKRAMKYATALASWRYGWLDYGTVGNMYNELLDEMKGKTSEKYNQ